MLNEGLLESALSHPDIEVFFEHKLSVGDFDAGTLTFKNVATDSDVDVRFDFCVGADGSYSNVRRQMMRVVRSVGHPGHEAVLIFLCLERNSDVTHMVCCPRRTGWISNRHTFHMNI